MNNRLLASPTAAMATVPNEAMMTWLMNPTNNWKLDSMLTGTAISRIWRRWVRVTRDCPTCELTPGMTTGGHAPAAIGHQLSDLSLVSGDW